MNMGSQLAANSIAIGALTISLIALLYSWFNSRETTALGKHVAARDDRVEKSTAYLQLEVHSSEAFRFAADHSEAMRPYELTERPARLPKGDRKNAEMTRQYYFQCLNLFEVCSNFRRHGVVDKHVYASWVAWFHEVLNQWYFRELWLGDMRENYTPDVRHIFDTGLRIYALHSNPEQRRRQFYKAVGHLFGGCRIIENWPDDVGMTPQWPPVEHGKLRLVPLKDQSE
jgi:hypothetical protein